jgi:type IV secretory pathway VirB10-like protein
MKGSSRNKPPISPTAGLQQLYHIEQESIEDLAFKKFGVFQASVSSSSLPQFNFQSSSELKIEKKEDIQEEEEEVKELEPLPQTNSRARFKNLTVNTAMANHDSGDKETRKRASTPLPQTQRSQSNSNIGMSPSASTKENSLSHSSAAATSPRSPRQLEASTTIKSVLQGLVGGKRSRAARRARRRFQT